MKIGIFAVIDKYNLLNRKSKAYVAIIDTYRQNFANFLLTKMVLSRGEK